MSFVRHSIARLARLCAAAGNSGLPFLRHITATLCLATATHADESAAKYQASTNLESPPVAAEPLESISEIKPFSVKNIYQGQGTTFCTAATSLMAFSNLINVNILELHPEKSNIEVLSLYSYLLNSRVGAGDNGGSCHYYLESFGVPTEIVSNERVPVAQVNFTMKKRKFDREVEPSLMAGDPVIIDIDNNHGGGHSILIHTLNNEQVTVQDPLHHQEYQTSVIDLINIWGIPNQNNTSFNAIRVKRSEYNGGAFKDGEAVIASKSEFTPNAEHLEVCSSSQFIKKLISFMPPDYYDQDRLSFSNLAKRWDRGSVYNTQAHQAEKDAILNLFKLNLSLKRVIYVAINEQSEVQIIEPKSHSEVAIKDYQLLIIAGINDKQEDGAKIKLVDSRGQEKWQDFDQFMKEFCISQERRLQFKGHPDRIIREVCAGIFYDKQHPTFTEN